MRVAVTGSSGKVGRAAVRTLRAAGHKVTCLDLVPHQQHPRTIRVDCSDFGAVVGAFSGVDAGGRRPDAVVHLAGIPAPGLAPDHVVFAANSLATYNVFSACARLGIERVVWASSETILGLPFDQPPAFAPLDESHPDRPSWSYALSKQLGETMADSFVRWQPAMAIVSLRLSNVYAPEDYSQLAAIQARPEARKWNLWSYVDADDCGLACRAAVEAELAGHHRLIIAAADNIAGRPSAELMAEYFPGVPVHGVEGDRSLQSSALAARVIGYHPCVSWRDRVVHDS